MDESKLKELKKELGYMALREDALLAELKLTRSTIDGIKAKLNARIAYMESDDSMMKRVGRLIGGLDKPDRIQRYHIIKMNQGINTGIGVCDRGKPGVGNLVEYWRGEIIENEFFGEDGHKTIRLEWGIKAEQLHAAHELCDKLNREDKQI